MRWLRIGFFILVLVAGAYSCSGAKGQLKGRPGETPKQPGDSSPETAAVPSPAKGGTTPAGKAETSQLPKIAEPQIPPQRPEGVLPAPVAGPPPAAPPAVKPPEPSRGSKFVLNFDNADLFEVIRVMAEMMKMNYIIDPRVKGVRQYPYLGPDLGEEVLPHLPIDFKVERGDGRAERADL